MIPAGWSRLDLENAGFEGFVPFAELPTANVPIEPGIYIVLYEVAPEFLPASVAGWFKGRDPSVTIEELLDAWVHGACVVYIGKADTGMSGNRGIRKRLDEYRRFGQGKRAAHWGGRYVFQLSQPERLVVGWRATAGHDVGDVEAELIRSFLAAYGKRPFANRNLGRRASGSQT